MSVSLESATRLSALKSKIDTATGVSSGTLSEAVDNAIERGNIETEEQTVTPTAAGTTITPSSGKYLSKVTVNPVPTETKTATPTASAQTVTPSSGKFLSSVSVSAVPTQTKEVTPTDTDQTVYPDTGKFLSSVLVKAAAAGGKTVYSGTGTAGVTIIELPVTPNEDDIFVAYTTTEWGVAASEYAPAMVIRIGQQVTLKVYGSSGSYGEPYVMVAQGIVSYAGTTVEIPGIVTNFIWYLIQ